MEYGCIGEHLPHSFSKTIHEKIADYSYELREIPKDGLRNFMEAHDFRAINVTIPYKRDVIPYLSRISDAAERIGAVNTIVNRDGSLFGYNTDYAGLTALIRRLGVSLSGKKVLILGTGGTSRTAAAVVQDLGAAFVLRVSRTPESPDISYEEAVNRHFDAAVIVNTTPVGMYPDTEASPLELGTFPELEAVVDAVYNPLRTKLVLDARKRGIPAEGGLYMLVAQAVYAWEIFTGQKAEDGLIDRVFQEVLFEKENIVLVGMPGSGKSTVGGLIAGETGRSWLDTDRLITEQAGMPPADIIRQQGERFFRELEHAVICRLTPLNAAVITTGGGAVLDPENVRRLKQNGRLVFLDRAASELRPSEDRPLSDTGEKLKKLYEIRLPIYREAADLIAAVQGTPEETAASILNKLR